MNTNTKTALLACTLAAAAITANTASAQTPPQAAQPGNKLQAPMTLVTASGPGKMIGNVVIITESPNGLVFTPNLTGLPPGPHGYHVHETRQLRRQ
jgi:Cu-Zn family superoxide dismutase